MNNTEAKRFLRDTAKNFNIDPWEVIPYTFATTLVEEARSISNYESVPFPVMDVFLEHGKNFIGSAFWKSICEITYIFLRTVWISTSETIAIWNRPGNQYIGRFSLSRREVFSRERGLCPYVFYKMAMVMDLYNLVKNYVISICDHSHFVKYVRT